MSLYAYCHLHHRGRRLTSPSTLRSGHYRETFATLAALVNGPLAVHRASIFPLARVERFARHLIDASRSCINYAGSALF